MSTFMFKLDKHWLLLGCVTLLFVMVILQYRTTFSNTCNSQASPCSTSHTLRYINSIVTEYDPEINATLHELIALDVGPRDPRLISLIRDLMDPPSDHMVKTAHPIAATPQSKEVMTLMHKTHGFFVEAGAMDGERSSNTIWLENRKQWTGLLVEMDPYFYTQLRGKNRHSWSINACLSITQKPTFMKFKESTGGLGKLLNSDQVRKGHTVPCFPILSLLLALNRTSVDYFSLDVEGFELEVLKTIPFDQLDINVFSVEYIHGNSGKEKYKTFMENHGYIVHKDLKVVNTKISLYVDDYIFVKKKKE